MTLDEFIATKPKELRLGQYFVNTYWRGTDSLSQTLYQLDGDKARRFIEDVMKTWQWEELYL